MTTPQGMLADKIRSGELELMFCHPDGKFPALTASQEQRDLVEAALRQAAAPQGQEALVAQFELLMRLADDLNVSDAAIGMRIRNLRTDFRSALAHGAGEVREPTPHWERRWPHDQPNGWNLDGAGFLALVQANPMLWLALGRAKYLELRVDTRDGAFNLYDRDKKPLNPDDVVAAAEKIKSQYGDAALAQAQEPGEDKRTIGRRAQYRDLARRRSSARKET